MALFDQRGQKVSTQYNAQTMNFGNAQNSVDLVAELQKLLDEIDAAKKAGVIEKNTATEVKHQLNQAVDEVEDPQPDKDKLTQYLSTARSLIENVSAAGGLVVSITGAIEAIQKLF